MSNKNKNVKKVEVLVIDDEEGMREGVRRILSKKGINVDVAEDGETAIDMIKNKNYDIAFVDLKMPGIDGFQVTEFINENSEKTVVVVISALATVEAAVEVTRHGAFDFLVKPFTPDDLLQITDRALKQKQLIEERERYLSELNRERSLSRQIINSMQEGVVVLNLKNKAVLMNPKAEHLLGIRFQDGMSSESIFTMKNVKSFIENILNGTSGDALMKLFEEENNGRMLKYMVSPLIINKNVSGVLVIIEDFTLEWKAEQDKNRFISMVAHELKSPIAAIINYINVILTGMFDGNPNKIHEILERCRIRGEALLELIRDLLYINKREAGKVEKSIKPLNLREILDNQLKFYEGQAKNKSIETIIEAEKDSYIVNADKSDMDRIFMNLISNGIKYNRNGGKLKVKIRDDKKYIIVDIEDTGIGMTKEEMEGLFQEFYRIKNKKTSGITGTGLGLATVKRVISEYNGKIEVKSVPDVGTTFTVYLLKGKNASSSV